jgi:V-type H+-transporting ATPase subunit a
MVGLFGYMIFLVFLKWWIDWNDPLTRPGAPPSLIDTLINIALKPGTVNDAMFEGQAGFQVVLLLTVFATVPIMLCAKPYLMNKANKAKKHEETARLLDSHDHAHSSSGSTSVAVSGGTGIADAHGAKAGDKAAAHAPAPGGDAHGSSGGHGHEEHGFGELFIHQAIETIEFVLGSISNTASYLRLWALSLAHSQLATVFWERALVATIEMNDALYVFIGWAVFAAITFGVLLIMDVLECFLHALRLHWVEFQNKFYKADGYKFMPFSYEALAEAAAASGD